MQSTSEVPTLEITLAAHHSEIAPNRADFLAQANQLGSGSLAEDAPGSGTNLALSGRLRISHAASRAADEPLNKQPHAEKVAPSLVTTSANARKQSNDALTVTDEGDAQVSTPDSSRLAIASLMGQLDSQVQEYARRPRRVVLTAAATERSEDALYLDGWRRRIEAIGNLNYPDAARRQKLYGSLRLMVSILPNGSIQKTEILQSSGHAVLDQAALDIVMLASPYEPFPPELRKQADIVEIIRTWRFHEGDALRSY